MRVLGPVLLAFLLTASGARAAEGIAAGATFSVGDPAAEAPTRHVGLTLDVEACVDGGCVRASEQGHEALAVLRGTQIPMRIRLHLDCANLAEVRGIAGVTRVVLLAHDENTIFCPLEPTDAYCEFRYWQQETRWDDALVAELWPRGVATAWPDPEGRVDEAEVTLDASALAVGDYDLIAALPEDLVDQYPCEEVRRHPFLQSRAMHLSVVDRPELVKWQAGMRSLQDAAARDDVRDVLAAIDAIALVGQSAPPDVLPDSKAEVAEALRLTRRAASLHADAGGARIAAWFEGGLEGVTPDEVDQRLTDADDD